MIGIVKMEKKLYIYEYPRPAVTVDAVVFRKSDKEGWEVLLIRRKNEPYANYWALPGGFVDENETLEEAVVRELYEETSLQGVNLSQMKAFSKPDRDPRGRTISIAFVGILNQNVELKAKDDAKEVQWFPISNLPPLAFDHEEIINCGVQWINSQEKGREV